MKLACLDTSVINVYFLGGADANKDAPARKKRIGEWIEYLKSQGAVFGVPAVAFAELSKSTEKEVWDAIRSLDVETIEFTQEMGFRAAQIQNAAITKSKGLKLLPSPPPTDERRSMAKFDALIMATAVEAQAVWLVHANPKDFPLLAEALESWHKPKVVAADIDELPVSVSPQANLFDLMKASAPAAPTTPVAVSAHATGTGSTK